MYINTVAYYVITSCLLQFHSGDLKTYFPRLVIMGKRKHKLLSIYDISFNSVFYEMVETLVHESLHGGEKYDVDNIWLEREGVEDII